MTVRTLFFADIAGRIVDEMTALGIKQDLSSDPAAPSPGLCYRLYGEGLTPTHNAQGDEEQVVFTAALKIVLGEGQSGGNRAQTSIELLSACEKVADMLNAMNAKYDDIEVRWTDGSNAVNDANLAKNVVAFEIDY